MIVIHDAYTIQTAAIMWIKWTMARFTYHALDAASLDV